MEHRYYFEKIADTLVHHYDPLMHSAGLRGMCSINPALGSTVQHDKNVHM